MNDSLNGEWKYSAVSCRPSARRRVPVKIEKNTLTVFFWCLEEEEKEVSGWKCQESSRGCIHAPPPCRCQEEFQLRSSQTYMRSRVLETEQGVCQQCGLHAHDLFLKVRDAPPPQRKDMLENTWLAQLPLKRVRLLVFLFFLFFCVREIF